MFLNILFKNSILKCHQTLKQIAVGLPLGAANSVLQGAASLKWLGNTDIQ